MEEQGREPQRAWRKPREQGDSEPKGRVGGKDQNTNPGLRVQQNYLPKERGDRLKLGQTKLRRFITSVCDHEK